jgi:hypothetical protein
VILHDELICRGLYPSDKKAGRIKPSSVPASHLWAGKLSVWRVSDVSGLTVDGLVQVLEPLMQRQDGERFDEIRATQARVIRRFTVEGTAERAFSLLDECTKDRLGNKHPAHAHIAICQAQILTMTKGDEVFTGLQEGLKLLFDTTIWERPGTRAPWPSV